jgi:molybdopterin-guanine dinucleotide biosynthesis protein A
MQAPPPPPPPLAKYDAIVLAGGSARRLGGIDKAGLEVAGQTLLDRALAAVCHATRRVVVGPQNAADLPGDVTVVREQPPRGGPVAAIEAGLALITAEAVAVLACDMPQVTAALVSQLAARLAGAKPSDDGVLVRDEHGRRQPLAAIYRTAALRRAVAGLSSTRGAAVRDLLSGLRLIEAAAPAGTTMDCDTWESVVACRAELENR